MMSYADNFEDVVLQRAFEGTRDGFYIDVGAYHPVDHSVTKHFYDRGWRGINVEPNPAPFAALRADRDRDVNLNIGLSDRHGHLTVFEAPGACWSVNPDLLAGFFAASRSAIVERTIAIRTLAEVCAEHVPAGTTIDFLKVDVEGHEGEVLAGNDWGRHRPRVVVVEAFGHEAWEGSLLAAGYHFALFEGVNRFYVRDEDVHLMPRLAYPANASDSFSIYGYVRKIDQLQADLDHATNLLGRYEGIGPATLRVAHQLGRASKRFPAASRLARGIVHRLTRGA